MPTQPIPPAPRDIHVRTWFIEPVFSPNRKVETGLVRVWGRAKQEGRGIRWWRSSSIRRRVSSTSLQTRFGTVVNLRGAICKKYAKKLHMTPDAMERFKKGFPATWKKLLAEAFNPDVLNQTTAPQAPPRRSPRSHSYKANAETQSVKKKREQVAVQNNKRLSLPQPLSVANKTTQGLRRSARFSTGSVGKDVVQPPPAEKTERKKPPGLQKPSQTVSKSKPPRPEKRAATPIAKEKGTAIRKSKRAAVVRNRSLVEQEEEDEERGESDGKSKKGEQIRKRRRSGGLAQPAALVGREKGSLAERLKSVQEVKRARRQRRVAFAAGADGKDGKEENAGTKEKETEWSEEQRVAFERQRNSVPADVSDYWEIVAAGVEGKSGEECRALWETSWASPRIQGARRIATPGKKLKQKGTGEMIADLQKASKRARSRNTGKFRQQTRELVARVAEGTQDELLEPRMPGAEATADMVVTPKMGVGVVLEYGTPGTEVRGIREKNNAAGNLVTPEILARGKGFGLKEADQYVALFKRRIGGGKGEGEEEAEGDKKGEEEDEEDVDRVRRRIGTDDDSEYSDESGESSPFF